MGNIAIPEEIVEEAIKRFSRKFLFVYPEKYFTPEDVLTGSKKPTGKRYYGICTACGKRSENVDPAMNEYVKYAPGTMRRDFYNNRPKRGYGICPSCGKYVEVRKGNISKKSLWDAIYVKAWHVESAKKVILYEFCVSMDDWSSNKPATVKVSYQRKTELSPGTAETYEYWYTTWASDKMDWTKVTYPRDATGNLPRDYEMGEEKLAGTFLENIYDYCVSRNLSIRYILRFVEEPLTELFYKMGFEGIANDRTWKSKPTKGTRHIDFTQRSPKKMFRGIDAEVERKIRQTFELIGRKDMVWCEDIESAITVFQKVKGATPETIANLIDSINDYEHKTNGREIMRLCKFLPSFPPERLIDYLADHDIEIYRDYINAAIANGAPLNERKTAFPEDLIKAHDEQTEKLEFTKNQANFEKCKKRAERLKKQGYEFEGDGICAVVPEKPTDIQREGKILCHCVGKMYTEAHVKGETTIIFIRRTSDPETPWFTLEVEPVTRRFKQCYGYKNQVRGSDDPDVGPFIKKYASHLISCAKNKTKKIQEDTKCRKTA